jgi:hypothetical protein
MINWCGKSALESLLNKTKVIKESISALLVLVALTSNILQNLWITRENLLNRPKKAQNGGYGFSVKYFFRNV